MTPLAAHLLRLALAREPDGLAVRAAAMRLGVSDRAVRAELLRLQTRGQVRRVVQPGALDVVVWRPRIMEVSL